MPARGSHRQRRPARRPTSGEAAPPPNPLHGNPAGGLRGWPEAAAAAEARTNRSSSSAPAPPVLAGVDEAGRGPVMGPLVVAGVAGDPRRLPKGIKDSKQLTPARREVLAARIEACGHFQCMVLELPADELNRRMAAGENLNVIETDAFVRILDNLGAERAVVDTLGSRPDAFAAVLNERLRGRCAVEARIAADATDRMVGAASILAKVRRDHRIREIAAEMGASIGSGYSHDPVTRAFLADWLTRSRVPPPHARTAWATLSSMGFGSASLLEYSGDEGP